jgi:hypothetical protein
VQGTSTRCDHEPIDTCNLQTIPGVGFYDPLATQTGGDAASCDIVCRILIGIGIGIALGVGMATGGGSASQAGGDSSGGVNYEQPSEPVDLPDLVGAGASANTPDHES